MDNDNPEIGDNSAQEPVSPATETERSEDIASTEDVDNAVIKIAGVAGAIASAFSAPAAVTIALSLALLNVFLPGFFEACKSVSDKQGLNIFAKIDNAILRAALKSADAKMNGLVEKYDNIANLFDIWLTTNDDDDDADEIKEHARLRLVHAYSDLRLVGIGDIKFAFYREDYGGFMLHQLVTVSGRYLAAIKDFYTHGVKLKLPVVPPTRSLDVSAILLKELRDDIGKITEMAVSTYQKGEDNIIKSAAGYTRSWDDLNAYRTTAILTGLDLVTAFQYLDPLLYPNGCHERYRNRRLMTFLNTTTNASATDYRAKITEVDATLNPAGHGVCYLRAYTPSYGAFLVPSGHYVDGLFAIECDAITTDGQKETYSLGRTGMWHPFHAPLVLKKVELPGPGLRVIAWFNGNQMTPQGTPLRTYMTQLAIQYMTDRLREIDQIFERIHYLKLVYKHVAVIPITTSVAENAATLSVITGRLANIVVHTNGDHGDINYVFWWHDFSVIQAMLPERSHRDHQEAIKVEQFHAVRAGMSIRTHKHTIIKGPGFTGGDLVKMRKIDGALRFPVTWRVERDPQRWFAGMYRVRIWYFNSAGAEFLSVEVLCETSGLTSRLSLTLSPEHGGINEKDLKYEDLQHHESSSSQVLTITDNMQWIKLTLTNTSSQSDFILDRLELIFDRSATLAMGSDEAVS